MKMVSLIYLRLKAEENKKNLDEFEYASQSIKNNLNKCKEQLKERTEIISLYGYQSKERICKTHSLLRLLIVQDESIKQFFQQCEEELSYLRDVFKKYQEKNKRKVSQKELENRSKNIDLLRRNLNLLQDEFKEQINRMRKEMSMGGDERQGDFINVFGNKKRRKGSDDSDDEEEYGG